MLYLIGTGEVNYETKSTTNNTTYNDISIG